MRRLERSDGRVRGDFSTVKSKRSDRDWLGCTGDPEELAFEEQRRTRRYGICHSDGKADERRQSSTAGHLSNLRPAAPSSRELAQVPALHSSLLAYLRIPVTVAQAQLGHADPRITLEIYTHVASGAQREAVERLERFLLFPSCSQIAAEPASKMVNVIAVKV
jgi:hypothetical protein